VGAWRCDTHGRDRRARRRVTGALMAVAALFCLGAILAACGDDEASGDADVTGYWSLTTDEETTIRIDGAGGAYVIAGLSPSEQPLLPADDGGYTIPGWRWQGHPATFGAALSEDGEHLTCKVSVQNDAGTSAPVLTMEFVRASGDPDTLDTRIDDQQALYAGAKTEEGIHALQVAVQSWMVDHDGEAPAADEVRPGGAIEKYVESWPENPYTGEAMQAGKGPGEYTYQRTNGERGYRFTGYLEDGDFTVP